MKKVYWLPHCTTSQAIVKENRLAEKGFHFQDIKTEKITPEELDSMKKLAGSYESLFSKRAIRYKELCLKDKSLSENDYRNYILEEYTFLKRPIIISGNRIYAGSEKKTLERLKQEV